MQCSFLLMTWRAARSCERIVSVHAFLSSSDKLQMAFDNIWIATVTPEITTAEDAILEMSGCNIDTNRKSILKDSPIS